MRILFITIFLLILVLSAPAQTAADDFKIMQMQSARIIELEAKERGWTLKEQGYVETIAKQKDIIASTERLAAHWENAAKAGIKIDQNSQAIESKSEQQIAYLRTDLATTQRKLTEAEGKLDSCRDSRKYIALLGAGAGFAAGWWTKGKSAALTSFTARSVAEQQILKPIGTAKWAWER